MPVIMSDPFDHSYENQAVNDLIITVKYAVEKQKGHVAFQGEVSEYVSRPDKLTALVTDLEAARDAALSHERDKVAQQDALMLTCVKALRFNAQHVAMVSLHRNDPSILNGAGYYFKQQPVVKTKVSLLDLVPVVSAKHGSAPQWIIAVLKRAKSKAIVELQITENPNDEQSWRRTGEGTYTRSRVDLRDLESAKRIYLRARYHEDGNVGRWSLPISIIVL